MTKIKLASSWLQSKFRAVYISISIELQNSHCDFIYLLWFIDAQPLRRWLLEPSVIHPISPGQPSSRVPGELVTPFVMNLLLSFNSATISFLELVEDIGIYIPVFPHFNVQEIPLEKKKVFILTEEKVTKSSSCILKVG